MSRTIRNSEFHVNDVVKGAAPKDRNKVTRDGHNIGTTRLRAQRKAKDFAQKQERLKEKNDFRRELEMINDEQ